MTTPPFPPYHLASRVCSLQGSDDPSAAYAARGAEARAALLDLLPDGWSFRGKRVLDFGCGAGRTLRHFLKEAEAAEIWGTDIDRGSIDWIGKHLCPPLHVRRNGVDPPLDFPGGSIDLIWALSVFTHLTDNSLPWLAELHRVLRPGGLLVATYMGRLNGYVFTHEEWDEDRIGMNVLRRDQGWDDGGPIVLMSDWWVDAHWGRAFEIVKSSTVHGQTWVLLRKDKVAITAGELAAPSEDPREIMALRHNIAQVERDRERAIVELREHYDRSLSWRITRPLRAGRATLRRAARTVRASNRHRARNRS